MFGLDLLGLAKYPKIAAKTLPHGWALGAFAQAFGDAYGAVQSVLRTGKCPHVRIHLLWSDKHEFGDKDIPAIKKEAARYQQLAENYPDVTFELSPFCEHNLKNPDKYLDIVKEVAPRCRPVNTPWKGAFSNKYKNEIHGDHAKPSGAYNYSWDGTNCVDGDVTKSKEAHRNADVYFFWHPRFNLKWSMKDTTPRPERKAKPDKKIIESVVYLYTEKGQTKLPKNYLAKSHAEKHGATDLKGDKLLIIAPTKGDEVKLKSENGRLVDTLRYYGTFEGGGYRYYSSTFGYLVALKALAQCGSALVSVIVGGKAVGKINPGFRDPTYR